MTTGDKTGFAQGFSEYENPFIGPDAPDRRMIQRCIHCGSCVTSCPTFTLLGNEMESPRGRIYIMRLVAEGEMAPD